MHLQKDNSTKNQDTMRKPSWFGQDIQSTEDILNGKRLVGQERRKTPWHVA